MAPDDLEAVPLDRDRLADLIAFGRRSRMRIILIDGPSGSGKSSLATALAAGIGTAPGRRAVSLVRMDDLYPGWLGLARGAEAAHRGVVRPHRLDLPGRFRRWNWAADSASSWSEVPVAPLLIVEGCGAASRESRRLADLVVWVETDDEVRRDRALARDGEAFEPFWEMWDEQFRTYCRAESPRRGADLVLRT